MDHHFRIIKLRTRIFKFKPNWQDWVFGAFSEDVKDSAFYIRSWKLYFYPLKYIRFIVTNIIIQTTLWYANFCNIFNVSRTTDPP